MGLFQRLVTVIPWLSSAFGGPAGPKSPYAPGPDDLSRVSRYMDNWDHYSGARLAELTQEDGTKANPVNFLRRNIDKINYFAFGQGYSTNHPRFNDYLAFARQQWGLSCVEKLLLIGQYGSVTGDVFVLVSPSIMDAAEATVPGVEKPLPPPVQVVVLPSENCFPAYNPVNRDELVELRVLVPSEVWEGTTKTTEYHLYHLTPSKIVTAVLDAEFQVKREFLEQPNPLGEVYAVHVRNFPAGASVFGMDDIKDASGLNTAYTARLNDIGSIVEYHGAPITAIFGAKADNLKRGPNKVWSGLPKEAKVEILTLGGDLAASNEHLARLKESLHEITGVPEVAQGSQQAISNTSGVALHTMYLPLIERADTKQTLYGPHLLRIDMLLLKWAFHFSKASVEFLNPEDGKVISLTPLKPRDWADLQANTEFVWPSPLPKDELIQVQVQAAKLTNRLTSRRQALIDLGTKNVDTLLKQIDADIEEEAKRAAQAFKDQAAAKAETSNLAGEAALDTGGAGIESGASASQGTNTSDSSEPKGRPKGT